MHFFEKCKYSIKRDRDWMWCLWGLQFFDKCKYSIKRDKD